MIEKNTKGQFIRCKPPWNKGLTKETNLIIKKQSEEQKGKCNFLKNGKPWNYDLTKETDKRVKKNADSVEKTHWSKTDKKEEIIEKIKNSMPKMIPWNKGKKGSQVAWNKGLTKETDSRVKKNTDSVKKTHWSRTEKRNDVINKISKNLKGRKAWNKNLTKDIDPRIKSWNRGLTKETDNRVKRNAEHVKENHWSKNPKPETIEKMRLARFSQKFPKRFTKIEVILSDALKKENILFTNHKNLFNITEVDIFIDPNICIYCDGDYWHANPLKYDYYKLDSNQIWHVERDKRNNKILSEKGFIILRFWETEIKSSLDHCIEKIKQVKK